MSVLTTTYKTLEVTEPSPGVYMVALNRPKKVQCERDRYPPNESDETEGWFRVAVGQRQTEKQRDRQAYSHSQPASQPNRQTDRDRQSDRQTDLRD
jgi:hypothetical protein